ncbi:Fic family protein [Brachybacterium sp. AOP42-E1-35]|uniref:Fic family protein n=1 Tax=Brachybacterium sp. AOP42-E1-35 TaxID=3457664 RepID=UPI00402A6C71
MNGTAGLRVPSFPFDSPLASKAVALERLRGNLPRTTEHLPVLSELADLYRLMSSIVSARIEGNHTTVVDAIEGARLRETQPRLPLSDSIQEILRLEDAAEFLDHEIRPGSPLTHGLIRELHHLATHDLIREGDDTPGQYRTREVKISGSAHSPPLTSTVHAFMSDLLDFANAPAEPHMQLVRMAIAHHRFVWIHPFANGNGRVARLFSYAMIRTGGFAPDVEYQTVNPTTVFGADRQQYYDRLSAADSLEDDALIEWADFVLDGLLRDLEALHLLAEGDTLNRLINSSISRSQRAAQLTGIEAAALSAVSAGTPFRSRDLTTALGPDASTRSRAIGALVERDLIARLHPGGRIYRIRLTPNALTPFVFAELDSMGLLPTIIRDDTSLQRPPIGPA